MTSNQNLFWGSRLWKLIHTVCYCATDEEFTKYHIQVYYYFFVYVVPRCIYCPRCVIHYKNMLVKYQFDCKNKEDLIDFSIFLHNKVNVRISKPQLLREEVDILYQNKYEYIKDIVSLLKWYQNNIKYGSFEKQSFKILLIYLTKLIPSHFNYKKEDND